MVTLAYQIDMIEGPITVKKKSMSLRAMGALMSESPILTYRGTMGASKFGSASTTDCLKSHKRSATLTSSCTHGDCQEEG